MPQPTRPAVQLATYAFGRASCTQGNRFPTVAYLVLSDGLLFTPQDDPIGGGGGRFLLEALSIEQVWREFVDAIAGAENWLTGASPIPARPLLSPCDWPPGTTLVLSERLAANELQEPCRYCDYQQLCGLQELQ